MDTKAANFTWQIEPYEFHGNLWLRWKTDAPFRAQQGRIYVYNGAFPLNPTDDTLTWCWDDNNGANWDTGQRWGVGWCCAWIAQASPNGPYVYVVPVITDATMGPDVAR